MARKKNLPLVKSDDGTVMAETTIKFTAPYSVEESAPIEEIYEPDEPDEADKADEPDENENSFPLTTSAFVQQLRASGIVPPTGYALKIEKFPPESLESGPSAYKLPCGRFVYSERELLEKAHLPKIKSFGPGRYWLTLRGPKAGAIVANWEMVIDEESIEKNISPLATQQQEPNPQFLRQVQQPAANDSFDEMEKALKLLERVEKLRRYDVQPQPIAAPISDELAMASFLMKQPTTAKTIAKNLLGSDSGNDGSTLSMILNNAEPIGKAIEGIVSLVFANLANLKNQTLPALPQPQPLRPAVNPQDRFWNLLLTPLEDSHLTKEKHSASFIAQAIIQASDEIDQLQLPPISHIVEMLARAEPAESLAMLNAFGNRSLALSPAITEWLIELKKELGNYYELDEPSESEIPRSQS